MAKFSDSNWSILNEYFGIMSSTRTGTDDSYLISPEHMIMTEGGKYVELYEDSDDYGYIGHRFIPSSISGNIFKFVHQEVISTNSLVSGITTVTNGADMYFRKDSYFHSWLVNNYMEYRDYINTNKRFIYFGKMWPSSNETNTYTIEFEGLKDFMLSALPPINQTTGMEDWLKAYFDGTHQPIYNLTKNIWSMKDSKEIDIRFLQYIANDYGIEIKEDITTELALREWVENLIYFLKRKGEYSTLFIVYKFLLTNTTNTLNIYERWHDFDLSDYRDAPLDSDWEDHHIMEYYGEQPSGAAGNEYYSRYMSTSYPLYEDDIYRSDPPTSTGLILYYKFDETTGLTAVDTQGNHNGTLTNFVDNNSQWVNGKYIDNALDFGNWSYGINEYVNVGDPLESIFQDSFSISFWFNANEGSPSSGYSQYLLGNTDFGVSNYNWMTLWGRRIWFNYSSNGVSTTLSTPVEILNIGQTGWQYCTIVFNNITHIAYLYLNNILLDSESISSITMSSYNQNVYNFIIGSMYHNGSVYPQHFAGKIDDFRIYSRALTTTEISNIYTYQYILPDLNHQIISPHYRVEIDLTSEPLGDDYIINKTIIDELIRYWNYTKPVSRFVTYTELIAPDAQIDGTDAAKIPTYSVDYQSYLTTQFVGSQYLSSEEASGYGDNTYNYNSNVSSNDWVVDVEADTWNVNHSLGASGTVTQVYDSGNNLILPDVVKVLDSNRIEFEFDTTTTGHALVASGNYTQTLSTQSGPASGSITTPISGGGMDSTFFTGGTYDGTEQSRTHGRIYLGNISNGNCGSTFLFTNIQVPQGATILSSSIQGTSYSIKNSTDDLYIDIDASAEDNPTFPADYTAFSNIVYTGNSVNWSVVNTSWAATEKIDTSDISSVIQSIVNRNGWVSGNSILIIFNPNGSQPANEDGAWKSADDVDPAELSISYDSNSLGVTNNITHNLYSVSGANGVITQFWSDGLKLLPYKVEIDSGDQLTATFSERISASNNVIAVVRKADYVHTQTTPLSTWNINHNLNTDSLIAQTFTQSEEILPLNIQHDFDDSIITFSEAVTGTANFIWIHTDFSVIETVEDPTGLSLSVSGSYWKVGTGTAPSFNPKESNDIETFAASGSFLKYEDSSLDPENISIIEFNVSDQININITEIGIFNDDDLLMFYTKCSPLYKPLETTLKLFYKIRKFE